MAEETTQKERSEFVEHLEAAREATKEQWASLIPRDFWRYRREAKREFLLAVRSVVDKAIERIEESGTKAEARAKGKQKVEVEVE